MIPDNTELYHFSKMNSINARKIIHWIYDPPYNFYNFNKDADIQEGITYMIDPENRFYSLLYKGISLAGYCSLSTDGQVPGGDYSENALDIGLGMKPILTGRGYGQVFLSSILQFARLQDAPGAFRITVAGFNKRAITLYQKYDFQIHHRFLYRRTPFLIMIRDRV